MRIVLTIFAIIFACDAIENRLFKRKEEEEEEEEAEQWKRYEPRD
jgi:hypothetical protein